MRLRIEINLDNAAFDEPGGGAEVARILRNVAELFEQTTAREPGAIGLLDINGQSVGMAYTTKK